MERERKRERERPLPGSQILHEETRREEKMASILVWIGRDVVGVVAVDVVVIGADSDQGPELAVASHHYSDRERHEGLAAALAQVEVSPPSPYPLPPPSHYPLPPPSHYPLPPPSPYPSPHQTGLYGC